ncbi:MAG: hypothetical protein U5L08_07655 [Xanthomonadales bacterium]|nr:hypothetical protein [Xanthomonadales bacterium]
MNSIRLYFIPFLVAFGSVQAVAQETVEEVTGNPSNAVMAADVGSGVTGSMEDYLQNKGWRLGRYDSNPSGGYIGWGRAPIRTTPSDKRYGRARTIAYTEAYTNAMAEFAGAMSKEILSDTMVTVFSDEQGASRIQAQSTDSLFRALSDRLSELSIAALDRGLERLGADPQRLRQYSRREKQIVSEQLVTRKMQIESAARLRGCVPSPALKIAMTLVC